MQRSRTLRLEVIVLSSAAAVFAACANSESIDIDSISQHRPANGGSNLDPTGLAGAGGPGIAGASGGGTDPTGLGGSASKQSSGAAGNGGSNQTGGSGGSAGAAGDGGSGTGGSVSGQAGSAGGSFGGSAGGATGFGGRGGASGFGGRGGASGSGGVAGRGGAGGSGGRGGAGGSAGSAGSSGGSNPDGGTGPDGGTAATFTDIYTNILVPHCSGSQCHNPGSQHGISFSSQTNAYNSVKPQVTPGNGANSSFYRTVNGGSMPPGGPKLSSTDLAKIKAWIDAGALNN